MASGKTPGVEAQCREIYRKHRAWLGRHPRRADPGVAIRWALEQATGAVTAEARIADL